MGRLTAKLTESVTKITITRNQFGDLVYGSTSTVPCLYRDISLDQQTPNGEQVQYDGLIWFDADATVERGDVYYHTDAGYLRVEKVTRAKDLLRSNTVQFIKCEVIKIRQVS